MIGDENTLVMSLDGKVRYFGLNHFMDKIVKGDCCFICGESPDQKVFNDEHVIPDWILTRYNLHSRTIHLPNGASYMYGKYKVPCCEECNSELSKVYEKPISELLSKSYKEIVDTIRKDTDLAKLLFKWVALIFFKIHLKDKAFWLELDRRKASEKIADLYLWEEFHHIHCMIRSHFSEAVIEPDVYGTIIVVPTVQGEGYEEYDYADNHAGKGVIIQLGEFCLIAVLNDSCAGMSMLSNMIRDLGGALVPLQIREILAHLNYINLNLLERPVYSSYFSNDGKYHIKVEVPDNLELVPEEEQVSSPAEFLHYYAQAILGEMENRDEVLEQVRLGKAGFLFDHDGNFIDQSKRPE